MKVELQRVFTLRTQSIYRLKTELPINTEMFAQPFCPVSSDVLDLLLLIKL